MPMINQKILQSIINSTKVEKLDFKELYAYLKNEKTLIICNFVDDKLIIQSVVFVKDHVLWEMNLTHSTQDTIILYPLLASVFSEEALKIGNEKFFKRQNSIFIYDGSLYKKAKMDFGKYKYEEIKNMIVDQLIIFFQ